MIDLLRSSRVAIHTIRLGLSRALAVSTVVSTVNVSRFKLGFLCGVEYPFAAKDDKLQDVSCALRHGIVCYHRSRIEP